MDANGNTHPIIDAYQAATTFAEYRAASALLDAALDAGTVDDDTESVIDACARFAYDRLADADPADLERHRVALCDRRAPVTFEPHNPNPVQMPAAESVSGVPHRIIAMPGDRQWWQLGRINSRLDALARCRVHHTPAARLLTAHIAGGAA